MSSQDAVKHMWSRLHDASIGALPAWREAVLCTPSKDGADGRTVILRGADAHAAQVYCYSDVRAPKISQCHGTATLVFWDPKDKLQLRLCGPLTVRTQGDWVDAHWREVGPHSRANYRAANMPGSTVVQADACAQLGASDGRENFAVVVLQAMSLDILWLQDARRMQAQRAGAGWSCAWVQV